MRHTVHDARPALVRPVVFFRDMFADLGAAPRLGWALFRTQMKTRYRGSWLGYIWLLIPAFVTTAVGIYVQSRSLVTFPSSSVPYAITVLSGVMLWQTFVEALNTPMQQLKANRQIATRTPVPHEGLILAGVFEVVLNAVIRIVALAVVMAVMQIPVGPALALVPVGVIALIVLGLFPGLLLAPVGLLYDDVGRALTMVTTFGFFLTPILYPTPPGILQFNPVAPLLQTTRNWIVGGEMSASPGFFIVVIGASVGLVLALVGYRLAKPHIMGRLG